MSATDGEIVIKCHECLIKAESLGLKMEVTERGFDLYRNETFITRKNRIHQIDSFLEGYIAANYKEI
jgi:hypothetical protein